MRISKIIIQREMTEEDNPSEYCCHCKELLCHIHLIINPHTQMMICINQKCLLFKDLTKLTTWGR